MIKKSDSKKIEILGICVDNYTVRESLLRLDMCMGSTALSVIETVTMKRLILAEEYPVIRECLQQADFCVVGEGEILSATGSATAQRMREIRNQDFLRKLLWRVAHAKKRVFFIAATEAELEKMQALFEELGLQFAAVGSYAIENGTGDMDEIVNEMNGATPDLVVSALDSPMEEEFILSHRDKIDASVWYGIGASFYQKQGKLHVGNRLKKLLLRGALWRCLLKDKQSKNQAK